MFTLYLIACRSNLTVYAAISIYVLLPSFYLYFYVLVRTIVLVYNHVIFFTYCGYFTRFSYVCLEGISYVCLEGRYFYFYFPTSLTIGKPAGW